MPTVYRTVTSWPTASPCQLREGEVVTAYEVWSSLRPDGLSRVPAAKGRTKFRMGYMPSGDAAFL